jgi:hypothetical protein
MNSNNIIHTDHITCEELERFFDLDFNALTGDDIIFVDDIDEKLELCPVCQRRYALFLDTQNAFGALSAEIPEYSPFSRAAEFLQGKIDELETGLKNKIAGWLDGAQNVLGSFEQSSLRPAVAAAEKSVSAEAAVMVTPGEDGFFDFELTEAAELRFKIAKQTKYGQPVCLVVFGRGNTDFSAVYDLSGFDFGGFTSGDLTSGKIKLNAGEYTACVPTSEREIHD